MLLLEDGPISLPTRRNPPENKHCLSLSETQGEMTTVAVGRSSADLILMTSDLIFFPPSDRSFQAGLNTINQLLTDHYRLTLLPPSK